MNLCYIVVAPDFFFVVWFFSLFFNGEDLALPCSPTDYNYFRNHCYVMWLFLGTFQDLFYNQVPLFE